MLSGHSAVLLCECAFLLCPMQCQGSYVSSDVFFCVFNADLYVEIVAIAGDNPTTNE